MRQYFELVGFPKDSSEVREFLTQKDINSAKRYAGKLAIKLDGPVDIAYYEAGVRWNERYITTASPSEFHKAGYRFERLDG